MRYRVEALVNVTLNIESDATPEALKAELLTLSSVHEVRSVQRVITEEIVDVAHGRNTQ